jgi:acyl-CoA-binding protein
MTNQDLESKFQEAVAAIEMTQASLPQDVQLRLYAFYKQATFGHVDLQQSATIT